MEQFRHQRGGSSASDDTGGRTPYSLGPGSGGPRDAPPLPDTEGMLSAGHGCGNAGAAAPARSLSSLSYCRAEIVLGKKLIKLHSFPSDILERLPTSWRSRERSVPKPC